MTFPDFQGKVQAEQTSGLYKEYGDRRMGMDGLIIHRF